MCCAPPQGEICIEKTTEEECEVGKDHIQEEKSICKQKTVCDWGSQDRSYVAEGCEDTTTPDQEYASRAAVPNKLPYFSYLPGVKYGEVGSEYQPLLSKFDDWKKLLN